MQISCGLLILNERKEILLCEVTGANGRHDIPKGLKEEGEAPAAAAVRECLEETGFDFSTKVLQDLGEHTYLTGKRLHLFKAIVYSLEVNLENFKCSSFFEMKTKQGVTLRKPEVLNAKWIEVKKAQGLVSKNLYLVINPYL